MSEDKDKDSAVSKAIAQSAPEILDDTLKRKRIETFKNAFNDLLKLSEDIVKRCIETEARVERSGKIVDLTIISKRVYNYNKCYMLTAPDEIEDDHMSLFKYIWDKHGLLCITMIQTPKTHWLIDCNIEVKYGENLGKPADTIRVNLSDIYALALYLKKSHEKKMRDYPETIKPSPVLKYPDYIENRILKIFSLLTDDVVIIKRLAALDEMTARPRTTRELPNIDALLDVGIDMFAKTQTDRKLDPKIIKDTLKDVISTDKVRNIQEMFSSAGRNGEQPDIGKIFGTLMSNFNPAEIQRTLEKASAAAGISPPGQPSSGSSEVLKPTVPERTVVTHETVEEIEEITEVIEEVPVEPDPTKEPKPSS